MKMMAFEHKLVIAVALLALLATVHAYVINEDKQEKSPDPLCNSQIYCSGDVLHVVQMAKLFNDSKTFVDMKLKRPPNETVALFREFMSQHNDNPSKNDTFQFVSQNFEKRGTEFQEWVPEDWKESPKYLSNVKDDNFRQFGIELNKLWKILGRKMKDDVANNPDLYSIIYVKNGVIVPGGRFLEFYYWDSYWIVLGLLHSEMYDTVRGMLGNFFSVIDRYGFIPNGGRIYYLIRSQPPMLTSMVKTYLDMTGDKSIIAEALPRLEREFEFFQNNRTHVVNGHKLFAYGARVWNGPRPESYYEDFEMAEHNFKTMEEKMEFFSEINGGAESGFDFTSRWFIKKGTNEGKLSDIKTRSIIPVELNAMLYFNAKTLAEFNQILDNTDKAAKYESVAQQIYEAVQTVLWNEEVGAWLDYDLMNQKTRPYFTSTNLSPLVFGCYNTANKSAIARKVLAYIDGTGIDAFPGGVPTTLIHSGEQWDYPNAWAPLQHWLAEGLRTLDDKNATALANKWTRRWTLSNYIAYNETKAMFEKYSAEELGGHGGGGEYDVQIGFGWTNGVIIDYLAKYGDNLKSFDTKN